MFEWFKQQPLGPATSLAMIGPRPADNVLFVGASRPAFAAEVGAVTRLNGRTVVVGDKTLEATVDRAAVLAGALLEFSDAPFDTLPYAREAFDIVATTELAEWPVEARSARLAEMVRVLRPGGRAILIVGGPGEGLLGKFASRPTLGPNDVLNLLIRCGLVATRKLAETDGVTYYEGRK